MDKPNDPSYTDYQASGFKPLFCKGYHPKFNPTKNYKTAKEAVSFGFTLPGYQPPPLKEIQDWEKAGGWPGWVIPKKVIVLDVEEAGDIAQVKDICQARSLEPGIHQTNNGLHFLLLTDLELPAASTLFTKCGIKVTYRVGGKNYLILAPTNGRKWGLWKPLEDLPTLPNEFLPYDRKNVNDVLNCLSWQVGKAYRQSYLSGYEDLDAAFMALLIDCKSSKEQIHRAFQTTFGPEYDERQTEMMYERTRARMNNGDPILGAGTFLQRVKDQGLDEVGRFARELQSATGTGRVTVEEEWPDPVPFDDYSLLPEFPVDTLSGAGRKMIEAVSEVNQVDPALPASLYLATLSTCFAKKATVDLISHREPLNAYLCLIYDSGNRKSSTDSAMTRPLYEFQKARQEEMEPIIRDAQTAFRIKEKRIEGLQKKAAGEDDPEKRKKLEIEAREVAREIAENPVPAIPIYLIDDVTPEKLGVLMAENNERQAVIAPEGGLFEIMAGRYSNDGIGNIDLFLKAHAGDYWSNHRIGRESETMQAPALSLCLAVQSSVIEEVGKNNRFRGKGLLARFLYALCKSRVGYRERQTNSIPPLLSHGYKEHIISLMNVPFTENTLRLSGEAQDVWDEFYTDIENEMRPEESLYYLPDWGSKLPGAVARIAGLLHLAEHGAAGLSLPVSVNTVSASCLIGAYFKEHALAVFGLMQEDPRIKLARQILDYLRRHKPATFKGRDVMRHTHIGLSEETDRGLRILLDRGYVREEPTTNNPGAGRPGGTIYRVNPKVF